MAFVKPPPIRTTTVAAPVIPEAATPCAYDLASQCLSDAQTAGVIVGYDAALSEANARLQWLADFFAGLP